MKGAEIVVKALESHNVSHIFGYPGGSVLSIYDELRKSYINHILSTHEQFAAFAADGYARASGKTGVVIATSGPGATNLVTGIANAYMDSIPLIAITGNVKLSLLGHDAFQETDIAGVTMPITKHNFIVKSVDTLADIMNRAFMIAESGRKGPVLVDIPSDILDMESDNICVEPLEHKQIQISQDEISSSIEAINECQFPFICAGGGVISASASGELYEFAHKLNCPVAVTAMGKGAYPASDVLYAGVVGMNLCEEAKKALKKCDLFISCGARFSERLMKNVAAYAPCAKILHIDIDASETGKNAEYNSRVVGDVKEALKIILPFINEKPYKGFEGGYKNDGGFFGKISELCGDCIVSTEVGLHQVGAVGGIATEKPRTFITSGGLGAMGYGLPASIGAAISSGKRVVNIAGDGCFDMNMQELMTAKKLSLPIIQIVVNNRVLGMIEKWQNEQYGGRIYETKLPDADYLMIAKGMGVDGEAVTDISRLEKAIAKAKSVNSPYVIVWEGEI